MSTPPLIIALDFEKKSQALYLIDQLSPKQCHLKVGLQMFTAHGKPFIEALHKKGFKIFLDLKFHDIPTTVAKAIHEIAQLNVWMTNIHALGGLKMMLAAKEVLQHYKKPPILLGVTALTSMESEQLKTFNIPLSPRQLTLKLAELSYQANLDGVVCSAQDADYIRETQKEHIIVSPGIRLHKNSDDDQRRISTPEDALAAGVDYLVVGRPITQAKQPYKVVQNILEQLKTTAN